MNTSLTLETIYMADFVLNATHSSRELNVAQAQKLHKMPREIVTYLKEWEDVSKIYYVTRCQNSALRQPWMKIYKFESVEPLKTGKSYFLTFLRSNVCVPETRPISELLNTRHRDCQNNHMFRDPRGAVGGVFHPAHDLRGSLGTTGGSGHSWRVLLNSFLKICHLPAPPPPPVPAICD